MKSIKPVKYARRNELFKPLDLFDELANWHGLLDMTPTVKKLNSIPMDFHSDDKAFYVTADVPGLSKDDIKISLEDNLLTIKGEKKEIKEVKTKSCLRKERTESSFERSIEIHDEIDENKIDAKLENGILELTLPKKTVNKNKIKTIAVK